MKTSVIIRNYDEPPVKISEILRYAGCRETDEQTHQLLISALEEVKSALTYKVCFAELDADIHGGVCDFGVFSVTSEKLAKNLSGCKSIILFSATVGLELDRLITKYARLSPARAVMLQAIGSERVEALCDAFCEDIAREKNIRLRPRFSPGYGDVSLDTQRDIFNVLECPKNIAVFLNDSLLMSPSKSVTAFVGICEYSPGGTTMTFSEFLKNNIVYLDGGMGTLLQARGLHPGELPERWNISHPEVITEIHKAYFDAGSNVVCTNTFGANTLKFTEDELDAIIRTALDNARAARDMSASPQEKFIALDIGPSGKLLRPLGDLDFEDAVSLFAKTVSLGTKYGADLIIIETMNDSYETKAALLAAKENSALPVIVSNAYGEDGKLMTGATPAAMVAMLEGMGADAIGANCSLGPKQLRGVVCELLENASVPVIFEPNAGLPKSVDGKTIFDVDTDEFSDEVADLVKLGVRVVGGCCGTTPEYIKKVADKTKVLSPVPILDKEITVVSSYTHAVKFGRSPVLIGEQINPTGKKRFKQALFENDMDYILTEGVNQQDKGVHILDVNVGLPDIDEAEMLKNTTAELQAIINLPLQIDTSDAEAMEIALRRYNGKAMINSVNGKKESMEAVFPLVKKYGGLVVALTLDENGIPDSADERFEIAKKILETAESFGIHKKDIIFDTLAMTISADTSAALATLNSLKRIKAELGCHTSLGVSNVSFGLPNRDAINGTFFALALENGLSAAIMNPYSSDMMKTYYTYRALKNLDENCAEYISAADSFTASAAPAAATTEKKTAEDFKSELQRAIIKGFKEKAGDITAALIGDTAPLEIIQNEIIPALNIVGEGFEKKNVYLPQLLMSAEAAKSAFEVIKSNMPIGENSTKKATVVIATVRGDVHDIGKNIVKLLLENYGYNVIDLGRDVPPEAIVKSAIAHNAPFVGLSALMTTTVPSMEETIALLRKEVPLCKIIVGGAVLTKEYADKIGADKYAKDAMETVRYLEEKE